MFPDYEAVEAELEEEAQMEEARRRLGEGMARGEATRRAATTTHPWDRDGSKAEAAAEAAAPFAHIGTPDKGNSSGGIDHAAAS